MLSQKSFIAGMKFLTANYVDWNFNINNPEQVSVWYSLIKNISDEQFSKLVKEYSIRNKYPPRCVRDLTEILVEQTYNMAQIKPEGALNFVRNVITDCGGWDFGGKVDIYNKLKKYPALYEVVKEFERELQEMRPNDPFVADRFRKAYEEKLRKSAESRVDKSLGLALPEPTKDMGKALPYEL